jgi:hypothetical protein
MIPADRIVESGRKNDCFKKFEDLRQVRAFAISADI